MPWRCHICFAMSLESYRDELPETFSKSIVEEWKKSTSGLRTSFKNAVLQLPNYVACINVRQTAPRRVNLILQGFLASIG